MFVAGPAQQGGVQVVQLQTARQMIQPDVLVAFAAVDRPHAQSVLQEKPKRTFRRLFELRDREDSFRRRRIELEAGTGDIAVEFRERV